MTGNERELGEIVATLKSMELRMARLENNQATMQREMAEVRGGRKFAMVLLGAVGGLGTVVGYLAHKLGIPPA